MDDAAEGYDQEGGAERDAMLVQNLKVDEDVWVSQQKLLELRAVTAPQTRPRCLYCTLMMRNTAEEESKAPLYRVMMVER